MDLVVTTAADAIAALKTAHAGDVIMLAPGHYDGIALSNVNPTGQVTLTSLDPTHMATMEGLSLDQCSNLTISKIDLSESSVDFYVHQSKNIVADGLKVHGMAGNDAPGVLVRESSQVSILNSDISNHGTGVGQIDSDHLLIQGNNFHNLSVDGIDGGGSSYVTIDGNKFSDFHPGAGAHPDAIQFWTTFTTTPTHDLVITNNVVTRGDGAPVQGIFLNNENSITYENVTIKDNVIIGGAYNGIYVQQGNHVTVAHNLVQGFQDMSSWIFVHDSTNSALNDNTTNKLNLGGNTGVSDSGNTIVGQTVAGDLSTLTNFHASAVASNLSAAVNSSSTSTPTVSPTVLSNAVGSSLAPSVTAAAAASGGGLSLNAAASGGTLMGGQAADTLTGGAGSDYLRGGAGSDVITGGGGFDDINGNEGNDTINGGAGNDWVVGGKDNDRLFGDDGDDIVYGNLGDDTLDGGAGADLLRGGQGNDVLTGGDGNDWLSGDLGSDTMTGGAGADVFHSFTGSGLDLVTDFHASEGDRVQLDPGTHYSLTQVGSDLMLNMGPGDQLILQNVQLSSLPSGWLTVG